MSLRYRAWLCLPAAVYLLVAFYWHFRNADELTGDEIYYLVVTESMVNDHDVDVQNNLAKIGICTPEFRLSQSFVRPYGWFSIHNVGLSALVALPWWLAGPWGARLMMTLCAGCAAPLIYVTIDRVWSSPRNSLWITLGLTLGMPLLYACHQVYPDFAAGLLLLFAAHTAMTADKGSTAFRWREIFLAFALAFLPWLHIKFSAPALLAFAWYVDATRRWRCAFVGAVFIGSWQLLAWYNVYAFERTMGPYSGDALALGWKSVIVFLGLHFDQGQGMFLQQPLWLLGLVGLGPMWRSARRESFWWLLVYASIMVPNAMHPNWYGGGSYLGRFGSTGTLLWAIPLAHGARAVFLESKTWPVIVAAISVSFQALLAGSWLAGDRIELGGVRHESVWACSSAYPAMLKSFLPFCEPAVHFWDHAANTAALVFAAGALASGSLLLSRRVLAKRCFLSAAIAAFVLAFVLAPRMDWKAGGMQGDIGHAEGNTRTAAEGIAKRGLLARSPNLSFNQPGDYQIAVDYQADGAGSSVGLLMLHTDEGTRLISLLPPSLGQSRRQSNLWHVPESQCGKRASVWVWYEGTGSLSVARLAVEKATR